MLDWAKEDIYSLGVLFYYIITGIIPQGTIQANILGDKADDEMKSFLFFIIYLLLDMRNT